MSAINKMRRGLAPMALAVAVACALGACKKDEPAAAAGPAAAQTAPAPTPESVVSATVAAMNPDQLRSEAAKAYDALARRVWDKVSGAVVRPGPRIVIE